MTPDNINHLIDAVAAVVSALGIIGLCVYVFITIFKNE